MDLAISHRIELIRPAENCPFGATQRAQGTSRVGIDVTRT
jgi:hypothetical protein